MNETSLFAKAVQFIAPEPCYTRIFTDFDFFNVECLKIIISKCLGFGIILGSVLVKLPQILKISSARSGEGISLWSVFFELVAISANSSYGFAKAFPFSAYGEGMFMCLQTCIIMFLVIYFNGNLLGAFLFLISYSVVMTYFMSPLAPLGLLTTLQGLNIAIVILSKFMQIQANFRNGSTGQLSSVTMWLIFLGSFARIFTTIQETGDLLTCLAYIASTICNAIIVGQIMYYGKQKKA